MNLDRASLTYRRQPLGALLAITALAASCGHPPAADNQASLPLVHGPGAGAPSLLLVTIDTWRWDYIGASGAGRVETQNLDRLARDGIYVREAVTPCPLTTPAHASILTGLDPAHHRIWDCAMYALPGTIRTLAEDFSAAGFTTAAFVASETLNRRFGLNRGFGTYNEVDFRAGRSGEWNAASRDGSEVTDAFLAFLRSQPAGTGLFAWVHYYDAHLPYRPHPGFDPKYPKDPYAAQVAFIDGEVGRVLSSLGSDGRRWRVVVVGDHGEGLGDRGEITHGIGLYRSTLHVPLIIHPKPEKLLPHAKPWGLVDLRPTVLEWYGLPARGASDGESLFARGASDRALYAASLLPTLFFGAEPSVGVRRGARLYLRHSAEELYDLEGDPGETRDVSAVPAFGSELKILRNLSDGKWPRKWYASALPSARRSSPAEEQNLRSLGYLTGGTPAEAVLQRAAIGQMMRDHSDWELAREAAQASGSRARLLLLLQRLVEEYPNSFALRKDFATQLAKQGRDREALLQFEAANRLFPGDAVVLGNMGSLYLAEARVEKAKAALEASVAIDPGQAGPQKNLGILYLDHLHRTDKAILHLKKYLEAGGDAEAERIRSFIQNAGQAGESGPR